MMYRRALLGLLGLASMGGAGAGAADLGGSLKDEFPRVHMMDYESGWMIRARALGVIPQEDTSNWSIADADASIDNSVVPELDFTYFFNRNFAVELIAAVTPHNVDGEGIIAGTNIGDAWLLPPTLLLQYHFDMGRGIKPYVGAGVNYTVFFGEDAGPGFSNLKMDNSFGFAAQIGVDIHLRDNWYFNVDVKKIWIETEASVITGGGLVTADIQVDPWVVGVGLGYRFGGYHDTLK